MIPLFLYLTTRPNKPIIINVNNIASIESADDGNSAIITVSGIPGGNWYAVREPFSRIIETIQAASVEQYDKLSQTIVVKNK